MQGQTQGTLDQLAQQFSEYVPTLAAGLFVLGVGLLIGWLTKRLVVRVLVFLRLDRLAGGRSPWRAAMGKGDVRDAVYGVLGTLAGLVVVLVFLDNAFQIWGLQVLSRMTDQLIFYLPTLILAGIIVGLGLVLANMLSRRIQAVLEAEGIPRASLVAGFAKTALVSVVGALGLWELDFAREIVLSAFLIGFGAIGVAFALAVGLGSAKAIQQGWSAVLGGTRRRGVDGGPEHHEPESPP